MAALAANFDRLEKDGKIVAQPMGASKTIYKGGLLVTDGTTGLLEAGGDTASKNFAGVAYEGKTNGASAGATTCRVQKNGSFLFAFSGTVNNATIGKPAYIVDDNTVALAATTTNDVLCGYIVAIESGKVWVRIDRAAI